MEINGLEGFRYSITGLANGKSTSFRYANTASLTVTMAATYDNLIHFHQNRLRSESKSNNSEQMCRNSLTALRGFLQWLGKSGSSPIGEEFSAGFADSLARHLRSLALSPRSVSDRKSLLNGWRASFDLFGVSPEVTVRGRERRSAAVLPIETTPFERGLRSALKQANMSPKKAALLAGVSTSALGRWSRGALPNTRSEATLEKLEVVLGLSPSTLQQLYLESLGQLAAIYPNSFRARAKERRKLTYLLKTADITAKLLTQWGSLVRHKTSASARGSKRSHRGRWTVSGPAAECIRPIPGINVFDGNYIGAASVNWAHVVSYLGFLRLSKDEGGFGVNPARVQNLGWLAIPEAVEAYFEFRKNQSGGLVHTGHAVFASFLASLCHPLHGYFTQHSELVEDVAPQAVRGRSWEELNRECLAVAQDWKAICTDISRDPVQPIQSLLDSPEPLAPVLRAMERIRALARGATAGGKEEALARRNELLLGVLLSNPLRRKNLVALTYKADNTGSVYRTAAGEWRIRIASRDFKNGKKRGAAHRYDVAIASWLGPLMTDYVEHFRPVLLGESSADNLFVSSKDGRPLKDMTHVVHKLTRAHIAGSGGFGPHSFRHLVASDWLRRNPNDFLTVAELLNDTLEVVMKTYAHLKKDDALTRHSSQLKDLLPAYLFEGMQRR